MRDIDGYACLMSLSLKTSTTTHCRLKDLCSLGDANTGRRRHQRPMPPGLDPPHPCPHFGVIIIGDNRRRQQGFRFKGRQPLPLSTLLFQHPGFPLLSVDLISLHFGACASLVVADCCLSPPPAIGAGCSKGLGVKTVALSMTPWWWDVARRQRLCVQVNCR